MWVDVVAGNAPDFNKNAPLANDLGGVARSGWVLR